MTTYKFFVFCPEDGFEVFETLDEALDDANEKIKGYLADGWSEDVTGVCTGRITHRAKMCDQVFPDGEIDEDGLDESGDYWDTDYGYKCNYKILPVEQNPALEVANLVEPHVKEWLEKNFPESVSHGVNYILEEYISKHTEGGKCEIAGERSW